MFALMHDVQFIRELILKAFIILVANIQWKNLEIQKINTFHEQIERKLFILISIFKDETLKKITFQKFPQCQVTKN